MMLSFFDEYQFGLCAALICVFIVFFSMMREKDALHRLLLTDAVEIIALAIIALVGTDLAEALILPGLVVGVAEILALAEIYIEKEGLVNAPKSLPEIEIMQSAPGIVSAVMLIYGIILSGFTGGAVAGLGLLFYFMCKGNTQRTEIIETISGYSWAVWVIAFITFMAAPQYWFFAVMLAGAGIFAKVAAKISIVGTMRGGRNV